ncbi:OsmC family protein [Kribbella sp. CA-294648]|uniref:OsmC family protein n=1 Tax=Kribbella sp. CA-294648 TaxID=3239948 RepID=UPI003D8F6535
MTASQTTASSSRPFVDLDAVQTTVDAVTKNRDLGQVRFTMHSQSSGGLSARTQTGALVQAGQADESRRGKFTVHSDEPVALLGTDSAASPAEYVLHALAGCYLVTLASLAAARHIDLQQVRLTLGFDIDLAGFLGIDKTVRKGAQGITIDVDIDSPATRDQLENLIQALEHTSPIRDTIANPVTVTTRLT